MRARRAPPELCSAAGKTPTAQRRSPRCSPTTEPGIAENTNYNSTQHKPTYNPSPTTTAIHLHTTPASKQRRAPHYLPPRSTSSTTQVTRNPRRSHLQDSETTRIATKNKQGRNNTNTNLNLRRKWRREDSAPTWLHISLLNAWVLISTVTMCVYTHHTLPPEYPPSTIPTQKPHSPQQSYTPPRYDLQSPTHYTTFLHTSAHQYTPLPRAHPAPSTSRRSLRSQPLTQYNSNTTQVSKMRNPYQHSCTYNAPKKTHITHCINLPHKHRCRRPLPPQTAKGQIPNRTSHPNPTKRHNAHDLSLKADQQPPTIEATHNQTYSNHTLLTPSNPPPTTFHPNN